MTNPTDSEPNHETPIAGTRLSAVPGEVSDAHDKYPPLFESQAAPVKNRSVRVWIASGIALLVVLTVAAIFAIVYSSTPRNDALASKACVAAVVDQMTSPSTAKVSAVLVARATAKKASGGVSQQYSSHATMDDIGDLRPAALQFYDTGNNSYLPDAFIVSAAVDGENTYGATVRQYALCFVGVHGTKVTHKPVTIFTSVN